MRNLIVIFLINPLMLSAQVELTASAGYASFAMKKMGTFQRQAQQEVPVNAEVISAFPSYWYYELSGLKVQDGFVLGASVNYTSTGARLSYNDYSGGFSFDQLLSSVGFNAIVGSRIAISDTKYMVITQLRPGVTFTKFKMVAQERLGTSVERESYYFDSIDIVLEPAFSVNRRFSWFGVQVLAGYNIVLAPGKLYYRKDKEAFIMMDDKPLTADWSGFRVTVGATFYIPE